MKGLRFADTEELCFEAWKRSDIACSALLCGGFADSLESRFQASKRFYMVSAVVEVGRSADIHEFFFQAAKRSDMDCVLLQGGLFLIVKNAIFKSRKVQIIAVPCCKRLDLLLLTNWFDKVRNDETCAVLSSNEVA